MCIPCIVDISGAGRRTSMTCIFATLPAVGDAFAFDETGGLRCEFVVLAVEARPRPYEERHDCITLRVRRRAPLRPHFGTGRLPQRPRVVPARRLS